jgi:hypothetical protein
MIFAELTATFTGAGLPEGSAEKLAALIAQIAIPALYILVEGVADFISRWAARKGGDRQ